jgi:hypothetical protein
VRVSENRVLKEEYLDLTCKRDEVMGEWRKLHNEASQVKANEVGGAYGTHGRGEKSVQSFGGKARRKETTWKIKA